MTQPTKHAAGGTVWARRSCTPDLDSLAFLLKYRVAKPLPSWASLLVLPHPMSFLVLFVPSSLLRLEIKATSYSGSFSAQSILPRPK